MSDKPKKAIAPRVFSRAAKARGGVRHIRRDPETGEFRVRDIPLVGVLQAEGADSLEALTKEQAAKATEGEPDSVGTARMIAFRCPADLEGQLARTAGNLGVSVSRAIDGLLREGFDVRKQRKREAVITQRLEGVLARLEILASLQLGHSNLFRQEAILVAGAMAETERGEQRLLDLLNFGLFTDPLHRLIWQSLPVLAKSAPPDLPRALEAMYHPDAAATELFDRWGGVKSYLDGLMQAGRRDRAAGSAGRKLNVNKHTIARAMSHVVGVAMNRVLDATDPKFDEAFADDRVKLLRDLNSKLVREDED